MEVKEILKKVEALTRKLGIHNIFKEIVSLSKYTGDDFLVFKDMPYYYKRLSKGEINEKEFKEYLINDRKFLEDSFEYAKKFIEEYMSELINLRNFLKLKGKEREKIFKKIKKIEELRYWYEYADKPYKFMHVTYVLIPGKEVKFSPPGHAARAKKAYPKVSKLVKEVDMDFLKKYDRIFYNHISKFIKTGVLATAYGKYKDKFEDEPFSAIASVIPPPEKEKKKTVEEIIKERIEDLQMLLKGDAKFIEKYMDKSLLKYLKPVR